MRFIAADKAGNVEDVKNTDPNLRQFYFDISTPTTQIQLPVHNQGYRGLSTISGTAGDNLIDSIRDLNNGGSPMSAAIARKVVAFFQRKTSSENAMLTGRENEILPYCAAG